MIMFIGIIVLNNRHLRDLITFGDEAIPVKLDFSYLYIYV